MHRCLERIQRLFPAVQWPAMASLSHLGVSRAPSQTEQCIFEIVRHFLRFQALLCQFVELLRSCGCYDVLTCSGKHIRQETRETISPPCQRSIKLSISHLRHRWPVVSYVVSDACSVASIILACTSRSLQSMPTYCLISTSDMTDFMSFMHTSMSKTRVHRQCLTSPVVT